MGLRSIADRIYNEDYYSLLHTNYKRSGSFREDVFYVFLILNLWELMTPGRGHLSPQGHKRQDLCIPNYIIAAYKTFKLWVLWFQRRFSHFKPMADNHRPGRGQYETQGHCWQDLKRGSLYIATHKM